MDLQPKNLSFGFRYLFFPIPVRVKVRVRGRLGLDSYGFNLYHNRRRFHPLILLFLILLLDVFITILHALPLLYIGVSTSLTHYRLRIWC